MKEAVALRKNVGEKICTTVGKYWIFLIGLITLLGLWLRWQGIWYESGDFVNCLSIWMTDLTGGTLKTLAEYSGDYNMPYVTILLLLTYLPVEPIIAVKSFSILFDIICAASGAALAVECYGSYNGKQSTEFNAKAILTAAYGLIFLSPIAVMNSGYWGQCDSVYVAFIFLASLCMLKEKYPLMMIFWGCAFAFKLQAIFAFPVLLLFYWKNKQFSFVQFLLIPITMEVLCLPAIIGGCSPVRTFSIYFTQMKTFPCMYYYYPNIWTYFQNIPYHFFSLMAIAGTFVILLLIAVRVLECCRKLEQRNFFPIFVWVTMTMLCFLPAMHERYGYMLEVAAILWAVIDRRKWWLAVMLQTITFFMYTQGVMGQTFVEPKILAVFYLAAYLMLTREGLRFLSAEKCREDEAFLESTVQKAA